MYDRTLIVARINPADSPLIADLFAESDATDLPVLLGVRRRLLFNYADLYFHYIEFDGDGKEAMERGGREPEFARLSRRLAPHVSPYAPEVWHSPADAVATPFYGWTSDGEGRP